MSFQQLLDNLMDQTWRQSLPGFAPEAVLAATIVLMLLVRLFRWGQGVNISALALVGTAVACTLAYFQLHDANPFVGAGLVAPPAESVARPLPIFSGLLVYDEFTIFFRLFLTFFGTLVIWLTMISGIPDREDSPDFYTLLLGALVGMCLMASANHLLMLFIGVEMASVPSYAMAGFLKGRRQSSEASLKYVVYGAGAAGVMLYGISLLAGLFGTMHLPSLAGAMAETLSGTGGFTPEVRVTLLAVLMVLVGIAFKLSAVPFHFWCPDVFEGASAEVAAFLSVASKGAALALLVRFSLAVTGTSAEGLADVRLHLGAAIAVLAAVTATFGNMAAYAQTNLKRLLAYSTIAHAGYMMMPIAASLRTPEAAVLGVQAMLFYLVVYLFMNLGAFAVVVFIRNEIGSEELKDYRGLWRRCPGLTVCMVIFLASLTGIPPLGGFAAKFVVFLALVQAKLWWLVVVAGVNTVISVFYYWRVLRAMILEEGPEAEPAPSLGMGSIAGVYTAALALSVFVLGIWFNELSEFTQSIASVLF
jgi:NADH-quinone oxidoreductase subunit N